MSAPAQVRLARLDEVEALLDIEDAAGRIYAEAGLPEDLDGLEPALVEAGIRERLAWVLTDVDDRPIGFALCWIRGDALHLRELDVHPAHMRRGLGRWLIDYLCERAEALGLRRVTLTTFRDVAWNAPYYASRCGFAIVEPARMPEWLAAIRAEEDRGELRRWPRVAMARSVA